MPDALLRGIPALSAEPGRPYDFHWLQSSAKGKGAGFSGTFAKKQRPESWLVFIAGSHVSSMVREWSAIDAGYDWQAIFCGRQASAQIYVGRPNGSAKAASYSRTIDWSSTPTHGYAEVVMPPGFQGRMLDFDVNWSTTTSAHTLSMVWGPYREDSMVIFGAHTFQDHSSVLTCTGGGGFHAEELVCGAGFVRMRMAVIPKGYSFTAQSYDTYRHGLFGAVFA